jgi:anti-sigma B factor antagonist
VSDVTTDSHPLDVTTTREGDDVVLIVAGELDPHTAPDLGAHLDEAVAEGSARVVLDLAAVGFIDSSGLRVLISAQQDLAAAGRSLVVRNPSDTASRLFEITGLSEHLEQG